jgi:hypothetical protein
VVETFPALWLSALALLPGALFTWAREQQTGRWGVALSDRLLRFVGTSALLHVLLLPLSYWLYGRFLAPEAADRGHLRWWLWPLTLAYVAVPLVLGRVLGIGIRRDTRWAAWIAGGSPAPRAWDHLFGRAAAGDWVVVRLKDGTWLAGTYGAAARGRPSSHASRYPELQELFLADTAEVDGEGEIVKTEDGGTRMLGRGVLVRWDEMSYLQFVPKRTRVDAGRNG